MADISKITLPSGSTYDIKDAEARRLIEEITKLGLVIEKVTTLPTASATTQGKIYIVAHSHGTGDGFDEYITVKGGTEASPTYAWEKIGTTDIDLSGYAQKGGGVTTSGTAASKKTGITIADHEVTQGTSQAHLYYKNTDVLGPSTTASAAASSVSFSGGSNGTFVKSYPGSSKKLATTSITGTNGTVSIPNVTGNAAVTIPNVTECEGVSATKISSYGTLPSLTTTVANETLTIGFSAGSKPSGTDVSASKVTLGTALSASKVTLGTAIAAAKVASAATTVATGKVADSDTNGSSVLIGLGTASTGSAITGLGTATAAAQQITINQDGKISVVELVNNNDTIEGTTLMKLGGKNSGIAITSHSVTDPGHTHTVSSTGTIDN